MSLSPKDAYKGDGTDAFSAEFYSRLVKREMRANSIADGELVKEFADYLFPNAAADRWYKALPAASLASWSVFTTEFHRRFPSSTPAVKTPAQLAAELTAMRVTEAELARVTTQVHGHEVYVHEHFANQLKVKAGEAGVLTGSDGVYTSYDGLPVVLRNEVGAPTTWDAYIQSLSAISGEKIRTFAKKYNETQKEKQDLNARLESMTRAMQSSTITSRTAANVAANANNLAAAAPARAAAAARAPAAPAPAPAAAAAAAAAPPRARTRAEVEALVELCMRHMPADADAHARMRARWEELHGENGVVEQHGYPLSPGTARPGSSECFNCGKTGHRALDCTATAIPEKERRFRGFCGRQLRAPQVNVVGEEAGNWYDPPGQGFGTGPAA